MKKRIFCGGTLSSGIVLISFPVLVYFYEADGSPLGFKYLDTTNSTNVWETYWFEKNLQGDVVAV